MAAADDLFGLVIAALVIDSAALGLRSWVRLRVQRFFGYDDAVLCFLFLGYIFFSAFTFAALHYGYGVAAAEPWHDSQKAFQSFFAGQLCYVLATALFKTGVALVLFRIDIRRSIRRILVVSMTVVLVVVLMSFFLLAFQCRPMSLNWGVGNGSCFQWETVRRTGIALSVVDVASNWLYSFLPIAMLYNVQMSNRLKISVIIILGIGFLSSIATVVRCKYILNASDRQELLGRFREVENNLLVILWSHVEIFLAILASSFVALRPLLRHANEAILDQRRQRGSGEQQESLGMERLSRLEGDTSLEGSQVAIIKHHSGATLSNGPMIVAR
ncbi:uncharacterized protein F4812DRAFT_200396 [Daldinia caldariorum]|uniref:uncharacterized protein n=1 Tax=Daldinia caldariorum TaxID=326644 RepID=UPI002007BD2D|nr:uncharacterized protein F4812DRAFT_200396 [Daldinia caldariorum]KAI1471955.1 hypothetical protein F4812DRAFT_200396 [Daldinia caldariorum]